MYRRRCVALLDTANDPVVFHKATRCMHNARLTPTDEFPGDIRGDQWVACTRTHGCGASLNLTDRNING